MMVPPEIVDYTLTFLHSDKDYSTLEACSVVFPEIADRQLYSHITFHILVLPQDGTGEVIPTPPSSPFDTYVVDPTKLSRILIERPYIANYVRVVRMTIIAIYTQGVSNDYRLGDPEICFVLSALPRVESIVVRASDYPLVSWTMLGPEFCTAFQKIVRLTSVRDVALSQIYGFSLKHFEHSEKLSNLFLNGQLTGLEGVSTSPYPRLRSFHIESQSIVTRMVSWMKSNTLRTLSLRYRSRESLQDFQSLIEACSATLVNLDVDFTFYGSLYNGISSNFPYVFPGIQLPLLDHLIFRFPVMRVSNWSGRFFLLSFIRSISAQSPICFTLHLELFFQGMDAASLDWSIVTTMLLLPIIRHPITLYIGYNDNKDMDALIIDVVTAFEQDSEMKNLLGAGKLRIIKGEPSSI